MITASAFEKATSEPVTAPGPVSPRPLHPVRATIFVAVAFAVAAALAWRQHDRLVRGGAGATGVDFLGCLATVGPTFGLLFRRLGVRIPGSGP